MTLWEPLNIEGFPKRSRFLYGMYIISYVNLVNLTN